jgi:hypothetical protein
MCTKVGAGRLCHTHCYCTDGDLGSLRRQPATCQAATTHSAPPKLHALGHPSAGFMRGFCSVAYRGATDVLSDGRKYFAHNLAGTLRELMESHPATRDSPLVKQASPAETLCCA